MTALASIVLLALTRAEIIERFRAAPMTVESGLVQVIANCPSEMRREYQMPIATFVSNICRELYSAPGESQKVFSEPGIIVYIGDGLTNDSSVVARRFERGDGSKFTRIFLPSPGFSDIGRMRIETAKAYAFAVKGEVLDDAAAVKLLRKANPVLRAEDKEAEIEKIERGEVVGVDDEEYLKMCRTVSMPNFESETDTVHASEADVKRFSARLYLYPAVYSEPFCGKYDSCSFAEAIDLSAEDLRIRLQAMKKATEMLVYGGGRGEAMSEAAKAYSQFLLELAAYKKTPDELKALLADADAKLAKVLEEARKIKKGDARDGD